MNVPWHFKQYWFGTFMWTCFLVIYSKQNETNRTEITVCLRIAWVSSINRGNGLQWVACVRRICTAECFSVKNIFFLEYRNLTWILTELTTLDHYVCPTTGIATWKWDFIAVILKKFLKTLLDLNKTMTRLTDHVDSKRSITMIYVTKSMGFDMGTDIACAPLHNFHLQLKIKIPTKENDV